MWYFLQMELPSCTNESNLFVKSLPFSERASISVLNRLAENFPLLRALQLTECLRHAFTIVAKSALAHMIEFKV